MTERAVAPPLKAGTGGGSSRTPLPKREAKRKEKQQLHGWIVLDKPLGLTSTQALGKVRWLFNAEKAGHGGTLDPLASGLLPIAFGEAIAASLPPERVDFRRFAGCGHGIVADDQEGALQAIRDFILS